MRCDSENFRSRNLARKGGAFVFFFRRHCPQAVLGNWRWILLSGVLFALIGLAVGYTRKPYTATAMLIRNQDLPSVSSSVEGNARKQGQSVETVVEILRSAELIGRVASAAGLTPEQIGSTCEVSAIPGAALIRVTARSNNRQQALRLANRYVDEALRFTQELQSNQASQTTS